MFSFLVLVSYDKRLLIKTDHKLIQKPSQTTMGVDGHVDEWDIEVLRPDEMYNAIIWTNS